MRDSTVLLSFLLWAFIHLLSWVLEVSILEIRYLHYCLNSGECTIVPIFFKKHFKFKGKWVVSFIDGLNCSMQFLKGFQMDYPGARNPTKWRNWYVKRFHVLLSAHKIYVFFFFSLSFFYPPKCHFWTYSMESGTGQGFMEGKYDASGSIGGCQQGCHFPFCSAPCLLQRVSLCIPCFLFSS